MKYILPLLFLLFCGSVLKGQTTGDPLEGTISYLAAQNIYVKFSSTENIRKGDTLYIRQQGKMIPALVVKDLSSISCVCIPIAAKPLSIADKVYHRPDRAAAIVAPKTEEVVPQVIVPALAEPGDTVPAKAIPEKKSRQRINGYWSVASFFDFSNLSSANSQRIRSTFSLNARNIGNSNLSAECYFSLVYSEKQWSEIKSNVFNGIKIYNLSLSYDFGTRATIWAGRKLNPKISNMGPVDGLQFELRIKKFSLGVLAGFRPDFLDYGFNSDLFQAGAYVSHEQPVKNGNIQTTLAFIEQQNSGKTDRRFLYLQHANSLVKNLFFFGSMEVDLYKKVEDLSAPDSTSVSTSPWMSNLYLSLNYRAFRKLFMSVSYSSRQNIFYYESYRLSLLDTKTYLERLLDNGTTQGFSLQASYRPWKKLSVGMTAGYRFQQKDPRPSTNIYGYLTYSQIPGINLATTASITYLESAYLTGKIYSIGINRDFAKGKLYTGLSYHYLDYDYYNSEYKLAQNVGELSLTWRIIRKLALSVYYEGTFEKTANFNRVSAQMNLNF